MTTPFLYTRFPTRVVPVGQVLVGGDNPIRIQSMVTAPTMDTERVVQEVLDLEVAGCEIVRITAATLKEAENLGEIKRELVRRNSQVPLVADIHFLPGAALEAIKHVDKVRINPGNYVDWSQWKEFPETGTSEELEWIRSSIQPLVEEAKARKRSLRIGVNHGSLSERILGRYGNTPEGMVVSAIEFLQACQSLDFFNIIVSMKSSNPIVMVGAYRLLAAEFQARGMDFPLHLGVTEAGDGRDGRIKSSTGIGSLLWDGLGDTIRVSLTEDSTEEIPVARLLLESVKPSPLDGSWTGSNSGLTLPENPTVPRIQDGIAGIDPLPFFPVIATGQPDGLIQDHTNPLPDFLIGKVDGDTSGAGTVFRLRGEDGERRYTPSGSWYGITKEKSVPSFLPDDSLRILIFQDIPPEDFPAIIGQIPDNQNKPGLILLAPSEATGASSLDPVRSHRLLARTLEAKGLLDRWSPVYLYGPRGRMTDLYEFASIGGLLLLDGVVRGLAVHTTPDQPVAETAFDILQSVRARINRADFISCPGCGRTHFRIQEVSALIKKRTGHLKGVKIGIMGCIVNGPGEMADADFGYVGAGQGKISLYRNQDLVERNIPEEQAVDALVELIRKHGMWKDPDQSSTS